MSPETYNKRSMKRYGWSPVDLGLPADAPLEAVTAAVLKFQGEYSLDTDGKVGPVTVRRILAERELQQELDPSQGSLLVNGEIIPVPFDAVAPTSPEGLSLIGHGDYSKRTRKPTLVVWHWDVCLSAKSCHRVLSKRGLSSHGCIDNDGRFYQFLDFHSHRGWHAGSKANSRSIGIDVSNAVYKKYQSYYTKRWGQRPEITARTNGRKHSLLGYYPAQIETAKKIAEFLDSHMGIPLETPEESRVIPSPEKFRGHIAHYHITAKKWDVAGFPFKYVIGEEDSYDV